MAWINSDFQILYRVEESAKRNEATLNVLAFMTSVNPMLSPSGKMQFVHYRIIWESTLLTPTLEGANFPHGLSDFKLGLYQTSISVYTEDALWFSLSLRQVGFKEVRVPVNLLQSP